MRRKTSNFDTNENREVESSRWFFWTFPFALLVSFGIAAGLFFLMQNQADKQLEEKKAAWEKEKKPLETKINEDKTKFNETQVTLDQTETKIKEHKDKQELTKTKIKGETELAEQRKGSRVPKENSEKDILKGKADDRAFDASALKTINEKNAADKKYEQAAAAKDFAKVIKEGKPLLVGGELVEYFQKETDKKAEEKLVRGVTREDQENLVKKLVSGKVKFEKINKKFGGTADVLKKYLEIISDPDAALYYRLNIFNKKDYKDVEKKLTDLETAKETGEADKEKKAAKEKANKKTASDFRLEWDPFVQRAKEAEAGVIKEIKREQK